MILPSDEKNILLNQVPPIMLFNEVQVGDMSTQESKTFSISPYRYVYIQMSMRGNTDANRKIEVSFTNGTVEKIYEDTGTSAFEFIVAQGADPVREKYYRGIFKVNGMTTLTLTYKTYYAGLRKIYVGESAPIA